MNVKTIVTVLMALLVTEDIVTEKQAKAMLERAERKIKNIDLGDFDEILKALRQNEKVDAPEAEVVKSPKLVRPKSKTMTDTQIKPDASI